MKTLSAVKKIPASNPIELTVIVPCYNEESVLTEFHRRALLVLRDLPVNFELLYVNDGSSDGTQNLLSKFSCEDGVRSLNLSRNFGKEAAMNAGIDHASGKAILFIDADLQDPPELMAEMVDQWLSGYDIVNMQRSSRDFDSLGKRFSARAYYSLMQWLGGRIKFQREVSDFRLIGPKPLRALKQVPDRSRVMKGLVGWLGFNTIEVPYQRVARDAGTTKWGWLGLIDLALESIVSFSRKPLRCFSWLSASLFFLSLIYLVVGAVTNGVTVSHLLLVMGSFLAVGIAMVGEYLGVVLVESKRRPCYLVADVMDGESESSTTAGIHSSIEFSYQYQES